LAYQPFRGILGLWPWPIVNLILSIIYGRVQMAPQQTSTSKGFHNIEKFIIKYNEAGDPIEVIVHRKVEPNQ